MSVKIGEHIDLGEFPLLLAPMEDVSDPPFRYVCKQNGVDMMYTEFISSEGLIRDAAKSRQTYLNMKDLSESRSLGRILSTCVNRLKSVPQRIQT